jgi:hypothetical protein
LDAGLAVCGAHFRTQLKSCSESYAGFLKRMAPLVNYDETRGTDESLMKLFLLTQTPAVLDLVYGSSVLFTHTLSTRTTDPPRVVPSETPPLPVYAESGDGKPLVFAYDEEHVGRLRFRPLQWSSRTDKRARKRKP